MRASASGVCHWWEGNKWKKKKNPSAFIAPGMCTSAINTDSSSSSMRRKTKRRCETRLFLLLLLFLQSRKWEPFTRRMWRTEGGARRKVLNGRPSQAHQPHLGPIRVSESHHLRHSAPFWHSGGGGGDLPPQFQRLKRSEILVQVKQPLFHPSDLLHDESSLQWVF